MVASLSLLVFIAVPLLVFGDDKPKGPKVTDKVSILVPHPLPALAVIKQSLSE